MTVTDTNPLSIQLQTSNQEMHQVVVIGYQTVRKRDLTGATGLVNMENANKVTSQSVGEAIQGPCPGLRYVMAVLPVQMQPLRSGV